MVGCADSGMQAQEVTLSRPIDRLRSLAIHPLARWSMVFFAGTAGVKLAQFVCFSFLATILSVEDYGLFGLYYALVSAVGTFAASGLVECATGRLKNHPDEAGRRRLFSESAGLFVPTLAVTLLVLAPLSLRQSGAHASPLAFWSAMGMGAVLAFASLQGSLLRLGNRYLASLLAGQGVLAVALAAMFLAALAGKQLDWVFMAGLTGSLAGLVLLIPLRAIHFKLIGDPQAVAAGLGSAFPYVLIGVFGWLSGYGINAVTGQLLDIGSVAAYTFLLTVSSIVQMVASSMNGVWQVRMYALYNQGRQGEAEAKNLTFSRVLTGVMIIVSMLAVLGYSLFPDQGGTLAHYTKRELELSFLFGGYLLAVPCWHLSGYYYLTGNGPRISRVHVISGLIGLASWIALIVVLGELGAYVGFCANNLFKSLFLSLDVRRFAAASPPWILIVCGTLCLLAVGFCLR